jgi:GT2 family glycosyltransferase
MGRDTVRVSVIIPSWNNRELLRSCLDSLAALEFDAHEVIVVDNGSTDGAPDMVETEYGWARLIRLARNTGFSTAVNEGIKAAAGGLVALINNDAEAHPAWLAELCRAADSHPEAGSFASKMLFHSDRKTIDTVGDGFSRAGFGYKIGWGEKDTGQYDSEAYVLGACGGAAMYRKKMLDAVATGGEYFDEEFFAFGEDLDLALRAQLMGYRCVTVPGAVVYHRVRATAGRGSELSLFLGHRNFLFCVMKDFPRGVILRNLHSILFYPAMATLWDMIKKRRAVFIRSYLDAFRRRGSMMQKRRHVQVKKKITDAEFSSLLTGRWISLWLRIGLRTRAVRKGML